jgi:hypothetical protein
MKPLCDENEQYTSKTARRVSKEINDAVGKIVSKYAERGYSLNDVERLLTHSATYTCALTKVQRMFARGRRRPKSVSVPVS